MAYKTQPQRIGAVLSGIIDSKPTEYRGVTMRSRLEVSFARHLDSLGLEWTYEPAIYGPKGYGYLPDFRVDREDGPHFFECKPTLREVPLAKERMLVILRRHPDATLVVVCAQNSMWFAYGDGEWFAWANRWAHAA